MTSTGLLAAEWRDMVMVSYEIDPVLLVPYVPGGTSLDFHGGRSVVSIVGLRLHNPRVAGVSVALPGELEQVDLRFYVWRRFKQHVRRGVVYIKTIAPGAGMSVAARLFFNEHAVSSPMRHAVADAGRRTTYEWLMGGRWNRLSAAGSGAAAPCAPGSLEAFVTDRTWGYARQRDGSTLEYRVERPAWDIRAAADPVLDCDVAAVFGPHFVASLSAPAASVCLPTGSEATLHPGQPIE